MRAVHPCPPPHTLLLLLCPLSIHINGARIPIVCLFVCLKYFTVWWKRRKKTIVSSLPCVCCPDVAGKRNHSFVDVKPVVLEPKPGP